MARTVAQGPECTLTCERKEILVWLTFFIYSDKSTPPIFRQSPRHPLRRFSGIDCTTLSAKKKKRSHAQQCPHEAQVSLHMDHGHPSSMLQHARGGKRTKLHDERDLAVHKTMMDAVDENLWEKYILNSPREEAHELESEFGGVYRFGRWVANIKRTCSRFRRWATDNHYQLLTEFRGEWVFIQYDTRVVICKVITIALPKWNGDSAAEKARMRIQNHVDQVIEDWHHFQKEVVVEGIFEGDEVSETLRDAMYKAIRESAHLRRQAQNVLVTPKISSVVAVAATIGDSCVLSDEDNYTLRKEWMCEQIRMITRHRKDKADYRLWSVIGKGANNPVDGCWTENNLDTSGLREKFLQYSTLFLDQSCDEGELVRLMRDSQYTTMAEILAQYNQTVSPMMTYLEINYDSI